MKDIIIRTIKEEDLPAVVDIGIAGWRTAYQGIIDSNYLNQMNHDDQLKKKRKNYKDNSFIVAELDGQVVGFCRYRDTSPFSEADCELTAIYVKPDKKRNGIGRKLFEYVTNDFKHLGKTKMILWCLKENAPSRAFYETMGGTIVAEESVQIGDKEYLEVGFLYSLN